jgi:predicted dehydrogenase
MSKNILIVGCGSIGERHLRCLLKTGRASVTACETNAALRDKISNEHKVPVSANLEETLQQNRFDGIVIATPAQTHVELAQACLQTGAGLLVEKPLSTGFDGVAELECELRQRKSFFGVGYIYRFAPAVKQAHEFIAGGTLGKPLHASVVCGQHFPTFRPAYREIYYTRHETGGGAIQDALTHLVNAIEWFLGPTTQVFCDAKHQALEGIEVEDTVNAIARNGNALVSYSLNQFQAPNEITFQIHCERGSLKVELHEQRWGVFAKSGSAWEFHPAPTRERDEWFIAQANSFLDGLDGKTNGLCSLAEGLHTLKFNLAALESARTGQPIFIS